MGGSDSGKSWEVMWGVARGGLLWLTDGLDVVEGGKGGGGW